MLDKFDCPYKEKILQRIWASLSTGKDVDSKAALLPASRIFEVVTAVAAGFDPKNLYLIDKSPQVLSNCTRKLLGLLRDVNTKSGWLSDVCQYLADKNVRLFCLHADFCGNINGLQRGSVQSELERIARANVLEKRLAVTIQAARELYVPKANLHDLSKLNGASFEYLTLNDKARIAAATRALVRGGYSNAKPTVVWRYVNSVTGITMLSFVVEIHAKGELKTP